jgi:hypothetical protein
MAVYSKSMQFEILTNVLFFQVLKNNSGMISNCASYEKGNNQLGFFIIKQNLLNMEVICISA